LPASDNLAGYQKGQQFYFLLLRLQSYSGLSYAQIQEMFGCNRRTAERKIQEVRDANFDLESFTDDDGFKHWRIPAGAINSLVRPTAEELNSIDLAIAKLRGDGMHEIADSLADLETKIHALTPAADVRRAEPDLEVLLEAEGIARRAGPFSSIDRALLDELRYAIISRSVLDIKYLQRRMRHYPNLPHVEMDMKIEPLGLVYGNRMYLIANILHDGGDKTTMPLPAQLITECRPTGDVFDPGGFTLEGYLGERFGVHGNAPAEKVVLKFRHEYKDEIRNYAFHPSQVIREGERGTLYVEFECIISHELIWHLFTLDAFLSIEQPLHLRDRYFNIAHAISTNAAHAIAEEWRAQTTIDLALSPKQLTQIKKILVALIAADKADEEEELVADWQKLGAALDGDLSRLPRENVFLIDDFVASYDAMKQIAETDFSNSEIEVLRALCKIRDERRQRQIVEAALALADDEKRRWEKRQKRTI
jgi:predicted DNA-binding transcriptional regulator YafY